MYNGYWFWGLRDDIVFQTKDLTEEYCVLNMPQEYEGPFRTKNEALVYRFAHPKMQERFIQGIKDMEEFLYGET